MPTAPGPGFQDEQHPAELVAPGLACPRISTISVVSLSAWEEVIALHLAVAEIAAAADEPFRGRLRARVLDVVRLLHLDVSPHRLRGRATEESPSYLFALPVEGSVRASQETHHAVVGPGRLVVLDTTSAYELAFDDAATVILVHIPRQVVGIPPILLQQITSTDPDVGADLVSVIMPMLVRLADDLIFFSRHSPVRLAYILADLLTTVLLERLAIAAPGGSPQRLMLEITGYVDEHLGDADLSTETIASAHYISPRYLRKVFEGQHMKVSEWIRARRLESCRRQLVDPLLADKPISAIAARWGFPDPAHFSRLFKATYGRSPRQFRREDLGQERHDDQSDED